MSGSIGLTNPAGGNHGPTLHLHLRRQRRAAGERRPRPSLARPGARALLLHPIRLLYAWQQGKRTWVILMEPGYPRDARPEQLDLPRPDTDLGEVPDPAAYQAERRELQRAYIERLTADNHLRHSAGSETELANLLLRLKDELKALRVGERRRWRRLGWAIAAVLAGLRVLGGGGWFVSERLIERTDKLATVTTERIRAHLLAAVEDAHRRDLAQAEQVADWQERERRREAAAAQRAAQLARIADLSASFAEIERQGEATSVFKELTRILQEPGGGVTQALAYTENKRPDILDDIDRIADSAQTRIRARLRRLLTSAGLYQAEGNAEAARGLYSQILTRAPNWPAALDESRGFLIEQGDLAVIRGSLSDAKRDYGEAQARAERLLELEPDNPEWQRDFSVSLSKVGEIKTAQGDLAGALKAYEEGKAIFERLAVADPSNAGWQRDRSMSLNKVGDIKSTQGDLAGALKAYEEGKAIRERLAVADPRNAGWQRDLYVSYWKLARLAEKRGQPEGALGHWRAAHEVLQGIADRGLHVTPEDLAYLEELRQKLGLTQDPGAAAGGISGD